MSSGFVSCVVCFLRQCVRCSQDIPGVHDGPQLRRGEGTDHFVSFFVPARKSVLRQRRQKSGCGFVVLDASRIGDSRFVDFAHRIDFLRQPSARDSSLAYIRA